MKENYSRIREEETEDEASRPKKRENHLESGDRISKVTARDLLAG